MVDDFPAPDRTVVQARHGRLRCHIGSDRLEHVLWPLVAAEGGSLQVLTQTLGLVGTTAQGEVTPQNVIFASVVIVTLPMILVFIAVQKAFMRGLSGSGVE